MRINKLWAALAIPALFAACAQEEELFKVENAPQNMEEVVGYELLGTDVTLNASNGSVATRLTTNGNWESTDEIGLGWLVYGGPSAEQSEAKDPVSSLLYANHQFTWDGKQFSSKGNIYVGWYFGYFPWTYEPQAGVVKKFKVNPEQKSKIWKDRFNQNLHVSPRYFIGSLDENHEISTPIELQNVVNNIIVTATPAEKSAFDGKNGGLLSELAIESITINADQDVFATEFTLQAHKLAKTVEGLNASLAEALEVTSWSNTVTTDVEEAGFVAGETANMVTIVAPKSPTTALNAENLSLIINVPGGKFVIEYVVDAAEGSAYAFNNKALLALAAAYNGDGTNPGVLSNPMNKANAYAYAHLNVQLFDAIFVPAFDAIANIEQWNAAVTLADKLDRDDLVFTIKAGAKIEFTEENGGIVNGTLNAPVKGVKVNGPGYGAGHALVVNGVADWNTQIKKVESGVGIIVAENAELTVGDGVFAASSITNNGTIIASANTEFATHTGHPVTNNGRIEVEYGTKFRVQPVGTNSVIAYEVDEAYASEHVHIKNIVATSGSQKMYTYANTLVFDKDFNLTKSGSGASTDDSDPYVDVTTPGVGDVVVGDGLNIEITNAVVEGPSTVTVANVTLTNATLKGVNIDGTVKVNQEQEEGVEYTGLLNVGTIVGDVTADDCTINATSINGNVTAEDCVITVTDGITGDVEVTNCTNVKAATITGNVVAENCTFNVPAFGADVTLKGENGNVINNAKVTGTVTNKGVTTLNNVQIAVALINDGTVTINGNDDIVIPTITNNGTLVANTTINVETITLKKGVAKTTVSEDPEKIIYYSVDYVQGGTTTGKILPSTIAVVGDEYQIKDLDGLKAFAALVNNGNSFIGKTVKLMDDINLNNIAWTPIGNKEGVYFRGTFDGNGKTISNLNVSGVDGVGLFGWTFVSSTSPYDNTIKNLTIDGATVSGNHFVGALVGHNYAHITGCTVKNATVVGTALNADHDGDKVGAIMGWSGKYATWALTDCIAKDCTVKAVRDAGQLFGCVAAGSYDATGSSAYNVTVTAEGTSIDDPAKSGSNVKNNVVGREW